MTFLNLVKNLPEILKGNAIVITIKSKKVHADCGKLGKKTVQNVALSLLNKTS